MLGFFSGIPTCLLLAGVNIQDNKSVSSKPQTLNPKLAGVNIQDNKSVSSKPQTLNPNSPAST